MNEKTQIKCPYCGSGNTAEILYGMPAFSRELREELDSGKLHLGGCCIDCVETENGETIWIDPNRYCNHCHKEFGRPPYLVAKDGRSAEAYRDIVTGIRFTDGGYAGVETLDIRRTREGAIARVSGFGPSLKMPIPDRKITPARWDRLVNRLYSDIHIHEWKKKYEDPYILDGEQWKLEITLTNRRRRTYHGSNGFPPYWEELTALFQPFFSRKE